MAFFTARMKSDLMGAAKVTGQSYPGEACEAKSNSCADYQLVSKCRTLHWHCQLSSARVTELAKMIHLPFLVCHKGLMKSCMKGYE